MNNLSAADRLAVLRRNELWRHASNTLSYIGAFAVVALIILPLNDIALTSVALAGLSATAAVSTACSFVLLRFIDHAA